MQELVRKFIFGEGLWWWIRHLSFWIFVYLDYIVSHILIAPDDVMEYGLDLLALSLDASVVYLNLYFLMPQFLFKNKFGSYIFYTLLSLIVNVSIIMASSAIYYGEPSYPEEWVSAFISTLTLFMTAIAIKIGKYYYDQLQISKELKTSQAQLEIESLKQQINPHFLFNVLNTINIQSKIDPATVSDTVLQFSDLLRYQIYEAGQEEDVHISKEIAFLKNYIELEQKRRENLTVNWDMDRSIPEVRVKPFLFLPLVENALKHSRKLDESPTIIKVDWTYQSKKLRLHVSNTIGDVVAKDAGGFGITNLKKRLNILYPQRYNLSSSSKNGLYEAQLQIDLDESNHNR